MVDSSPDAPNLRYCGRVADLARGFPEKRLLSNVPEGQPEAGLAKGALAGTHRTARGSDRRWRRRLPRNLRGEAVCMGCCDWRRAVGSSAPRSNRPCSGLLVGCDLVWLD